MCNTAITDNTNVRSGVHCPSCHVGWGCPPCHRDYSAADTFLDDRIDALRQRTCQGYAFPCWAFLVLYRFRVIDHKNWQKLTKLGPKICFFWWEIDPLMEKNFKISPLRNDACGHGFTYFCQVSRKFVKRNWPKRRVMFLTEKKVCILLLSPAPLERSRQKIHRVTLFPRSSCILLSFVQITSSFLRDMRENLFYDHGDICVKRLKPVYVSRRHVVTSALLSLYTPDASTWLLWCLKTSAPHETYTHEKVWMSLFTPVATRNSVIYHCAALPAELKNSRCFITIQPACTWKDLCSSVGWTSERGVDHRRTAIILQRCVTSACGRLLLCSK